MFSKKNNKKIYMSLAIGIVLILALILGVTSFQQYEDAPGVEIPTGDIEFSEEEETRGVITRCSWTMGVCEETVGKCYAISGVERGNEIICASIEKKDELEGLVGKEVILKGINRETSEMDPVPDKMCPCYIEYTSLEVVTD